MNEAALEDSGCEWILMDFGAKYLHVFHCKPTERPQVSKREVLLMVERGDYLSESLQFSILIARGSE